MAAVEQVEMNRAKLTKIAWLDMRPAAEESSAEQHFRGIRPLAANGRTAMSSRVRE
jgi:hypothetical protein